MNPQYSPCPHCGASVWDSQAQCNSCHKYIERCNVCKSPVYQGREVCTRCGNYVAKEPKLIVKTVVLGENVAGREMALKISMKNIGNLKTTARYGFQLPEELEAPEVKCEDVDMEPGQTIDREYHFVAGKPGKYELPAFDVVFTKGDGKESVTKHPPLTLHIEGLPKLITTVKLNAPEFTLGEEVLLFVKIANKGSAFARNIRLQVFTPPSLTVMDTKGFLAILGVNEERTALVRLFPNFDGKHQVELKLHYETPSTQRGGPPNQLMDAGTVDIEVRSGLSD